MTTALAFQIGFIGCMAWAALTDLYTFRIFNPLIVTLLCGFGLFAIPTCLADEAMWWPLIGWHLLAALTVFVIFLIFYAIGQMGAGDVKLVAATALWLGWNRVTLDYVLYALIAGGVLTIILVIWRRFPLPAALDRVRFIRRLHIRKRKIPYGISLGGAGIWASFHAPIFQM